MTPIGGPPITAPEKSGAADGEEKTSDAENRAQLDLASDPAVPKPFTVKALELASSLDPKNPEAIKGWGGTSGLLAKLGSDATHGLRTRFGMSRSGTGTGGDAPRANVEKDPASDTRRPRADSSGSQPPGDDGGEVYAASLEQRKGAYGVNNLPERKSKSLFKLMWIAVQDRVLVSFFLPLPLFRGPLFRFL